MGGLIVLGAVVAALVIFDVLVLMYGVDSRPGFEIGLVGRTPAGTLSL